MKKNGLICIDFWNTLVNGSAENGALRGEVRRQALKNVAIELGTSLEDETIKTAFSKAFATFTKEWFGRQRTPLTTEIATSVCQELNISPNESQFKKLVHVFQHSFLDAPPPWNQGVTEVIPELTQHFDLALISDTMFSPGSIIRGYFEESNLLKYFQTMVFSDEAGCSKPHERMYRLAMDSGNYSPEQTWHVGDLERTDIKGAKALGIRAILFVQINSSDAANTTADHVAGNWHEVKQLVTESGY